MYKELRNDIFENLATQGFENWEIYKSNNMQKNLIFETSEIKIKNTRIENSKYQ